MPIVLALGTHVREGSTEKRKRNGTPKVRTGCATCKIRHLKCDEQKPSCLRCESFNLVCQGYPELTARRRRARPKRVEFTAPRPLVPRDRPALAPAESPSPSPTSPPCLAVSICRSPPSMPKLAVGDGVYFDYFRRQVVNNVAGLHTTNIWSRLVAGEGLEDDCIHHSVLAIGAFMRSTAQASNEQHHQVALQHHITAVTSFRQRIQFMAASSPAAVVMTTLLLAVFELLQGKLDAASSMVNSAIALLGDFSTPAQGEGAVVARRLSSRELHDIDWVLPSISVMDRLSHVARQPRCGMHLSQIEAEFRPPRPGRDSVSELFTRWGRFFTTSILFLQQSTFCGPKAVSEQELLESRPQQEALLSRLQKWKAVLVEYACSPHIDTTSQNALRLARVHWMLLYITVSCCLDPTHVIYDSFEDEFLVLSLECVDLVRDGWSHNPPTSVLLGEGLILPLSTVVRLCRNHDIRMKAAEALASLPSSIVAWDIQNLLDGLLGVVFLEELGRNDAGFVPPESRWCYFEDEQSTLGGNQDKVFQNLISDETNAPIRKTLSPDLDLRAEICKVAGCTKDHSDFDEG